MGERLQHVPNHTRGRNLRCTQHTTHKHLGIQQGQDASGIMASPTGFPQTTLAIWFVTYCGVQLVKERERTLALEEEQRKDKEKLE